MCVCVCVCARARPLICGVYVKQYVVSWVCFCGGGFVFVEGGLQRDDGCLSSSGGKPKCCNLIGCNCTTHNILKHYPLTPVCCLQSIDDVEEITSMNLPITQISL